MQFRWTGLILAPLLVPLVFCAVFASMSGTANPAVSFLILMIPSCIISYATTLLLFLPALFLLSVWRPLTALNVCMLGLMLGVAVILPLTWVSWKSSGPDSGPPIENFVAFFVRWAADPFTVIYPVAGLITAGLYWWLAIAPRGQSIPRTNKLR